MGGFRSEGGDTEPFAIAPERSYPDLRTARLIGEPLTLAHLPHICRLHSDPRVMRTLSADGNVLPDEVTREGVELAKRHWKEHGFGFWAFFHADDGRFIGRGGLKRYVIDERDVVGLAYAVPSEDWGQGYATEMARASIACGFEVFGLAEIASWALPHNLASRRVMEKLGFVLEGEIVFAGLPHLYYRLPGG